LEATNSYLRQQLQELQGKLENSQIQEESEIAKSCLSQKICELNHQLAAYKSVLAKDATEKECIKAEVEAFKGKFKYTVVNFSIIYLFFIYLLRFPKQQTFTTKKIRYIRKKKLEKNTSGRITAGGN